ncbi:MAG: beta-propeller fold lactonase family protein, partial [Chthoniobacteraceae bacterium]
DQAITAFKLEADGKLQLIETRVNGSGEFEAFEGGNDIKVSNDGKYVYALGTLSDRLVRFQRDPESGKLTFLGSQPVGHHATPGAAGLCFSPDNKFVYVADEDANEVVVYQQP